MDAKCERKKLSVAIVVDFADAGETGWRNPGQWHRGLDQRTTRVAARPIELAEALSDEFHL
jgi:hypothetical protein